MITLILNAEQSEEETIGVPIESFVHQRVERFIYRSSVGPDCVPLDLYSVGEKTSSDSVLINDLSTSIQANTLPPSSRGRRILFTGSSYTSAHRNLEFTNKFFLSNGRRQPLWYVHSLKENSKNLRILRVSNQGSEFISEGFIKNGDSVYTNYRNVVKNNRWQYYMLSYLSDDGPVLEVLNSVPIVHESTWEDVDLDTGTWKEGALAYSVSEVAAGYTFSLSTRDSWYVRSDETRFIQPMLPLKSSREDSWYVRFSLGSFYADVCGAVRKYSIPEYLSQQYWPAYPNKQVEELPAKLLAPNMVWVPVEKIYIDDNSSYFCDLYVYGPDGSATHTITSDETKSGTPSQGTLRWTTGVQSISENGFIHLSRNLPLDSTVTVSCIYESSDFEYSSIDMNPLYEPIRNSQFVSFYLKPDALVKGLECLVVDSLGKIVWCSDVERQLMIGDVYNEDTLIGKQYKSEFIDVMTTADDESPEAYFVLCEASLLSSDNNSSAVFIDVRRDSGLVDVEKSVRYNYKLANSEYGVGQFGYVMPRRGAVLFEVPLTYLEEYGGNLTKDQVTDNVTRHLPATNYAVITWVYPSVDLICEVSEPENVQLYWTAVGIDYSYKVYRRGSRSSEWTLLDTVVDVSGVIDVLTFTDETALVDTNYFYCCRVVVGDNEFPYLYDVEVKVAA